MTTPNVLLKDIAGALGVSAGRVSHYRAMGMPVDDGVEACLAWKAANIRARAKGMPQIRPPGAGASSGTGRAPAAGAPPAAGIAADNAQRQDPGEAGGYWTSRARREAADAAKAELQLAELRGVLVRTAAARASWARKLAQARQVLLDASARLTPLLVAASDPAEIARLVDSEHTRVLEILSGGVADDDGADRT